MQITNLTQLYQLLPEEERLMVDVLRGIIQDYLPEYGREKISYNVPYFYGHRGICIVWPATVPRGGIKSGVLLGLWQGFRLKDEDHYLTKGTNKKIFYRIFQKVEEIDEEAIGKILKEAVELDRTLG